MTYLDQEGHSLSAVQKAVVVCQGEVHHLCLSVHGPFNLSSMGTYWSDLNLAVDGDRAVLDGVETEHG